MVRVGVPRPTFFFAHLFLKKYEYKTSNFKIHFAQKLNSRNPKVEKLREMDLEISSLIYLYFFRNKSRPEWGAGVRCDPDHGSAGTITQKLRDLNSPIPLLHPSAGS